MSISVIIPTLNEASCLAETLASLQAHHPHEIIVVDGGSQDATREIAAPADILLKTSPGRAQQMNMGASRATGDVLLFLHADCHLEQGALDEAEQCLQSSGVIAGCFTMNVCESSWIYRWINGCATARVRLTGLIYGDQGLFLRRDHFQSLGGFPELRFMEDVFFCRILRGKGRIVVSPKRVYVSARRWQNYGAIRQTLRNWTLTGLVATGMHPDRLARFYPEAR